MSVPEVGLAASTAERPVVLLKLVLPCFGRLSHQETTGAKHGEASQDGSFERDCFAISVGRSEYCAAVWLGGTLTVTAMLFRCVALAT